MSWTEYIRENKDNLIKSLNMRLGAMKKFRYLTTFKNRKMIAEGVFMSKLTYIIALWGGCGVVIKKSLQIIQNKVAQVVTRRDWSVSTTKKLLSQCGWLSVNQLAFYHSILQVFKVRQSREPRYLYSMHNSWSYNFTTGQAENGLIRVVQKPKLEQTRESFRWRAANSYNQLPTNIRTCTKVEQFKKMVKAWIMDNIPI